MNKIKVTKKGLRTKMVRNVVKKVVKKRAYVPKRKKAVVSPDRISNIDILHYWSTGVKRLDKDNDYDLVSEGNILHFEGGEGEEQVAYQDPNGKIIINGDEHSWDDDHSTVIELLQKLSDSVTASFKCFEKADIDLNDITVLDSHTDLNIRIEKNDKVKFKDAHKNVPKGATLTIHRNYNSKTNKYTGAIWMKKIHRAGALLLIAKGKTYIASMDEIQYYIIECCKPAKTLVGAFNDLKPSRIRAWEKKNKDVAIRQGEWYFIPAPKSIKFGDDIHHGTPLPMKSADSNPHTCDEFQEIKKRYYVAGDISHDEHDSMNFANIHEAIENTAVNAWSVEGVD